MEAILRYIGCACVVDQRHPITMAGLILSVHIDFSKVLTLSVFYAVMISGVDHVCDTVEPFPKDCWK
jgi:hypothetical protein